MSRMIIHAGTHKTGTTAIQFSLSANRQALKSRGIYYPDASAYFGGKRESHHALAHALSRQPSGLERQLVRFREHLREAAQKYHTIIISAEPFYRQTMAAPETGRGTKTTERDDRRRYVKHFAEYFAEFEPEICLYFRREDTLMESLYTSSVVNTGFRGDFNSFVSRHGMFVDYQFNMDLFREHFPSTKFRVYDSPQGNDIVERFYNDNELGKPTVDTPERIRSSISKKATIWINQCKLRDNLDRKETRRRWMFALDGENQKMLADEKPVSYWESTAARDLFLSNLGTRSAELNFVKPDDTPEQAHLHPDDATRFDAAYQEWISAKHSLIQDREKHRVPAYLGWNADMPSRETCQLRAAICCCTYARPKMLDALLASYAELEIPANLEPVFVIVDNGESKGIEDQIEGYRSKLPGQIILAREPEKGIPFARNHAVETALSSNADIILFVDDDEEVEPNWLSEIVHTYRHSDAMLIGGPVRANYTKKPEGRFHRFMFNGVAKRYLHVARKAERRLRANKMNRLSIVTNNWLADARLFTQQNLSFDISLRYTGGSDIRFFRQVISRGLATGWSPAAWVRETVPKERLTLKYQFCRARDQSRTAVQQKYENKKTPKYLIKNTALITLKSIILVLSLVTLPFTGSFGVVRATRGFGWIVGRVSGLCGMKSELYLVPTGE